MSSTMVRDLIDAGIHFGHRASRWNPKMSPYIFGKRNGIHIIDIKQTVKGLLLARKFVAQTVAKGDDVLFVGTKRQARSTVQAEAERCGMHYVSERWLGGMLTNFRTVRSRLERLEELEQMVESGEMDNSSKKMRARMMREKRKIARNLTGVRKMEKLPGVLVLVDAGREHIPIKEARKLGIPTICLLDTDSDPDVVDLPIPGNDDAMRAVEVVLSSMADAVEEGVRGRVSAPKGDGGGGRRSSRVTARADEGGSEPAVVRTPPQAEVPAEAAPAAAPEQAPAAEAAGDVPADDAAGQSEA